MSGESFILLVTAASVGFIHTLLGPDHYIPFIVLSKARGWTVRKTAIITALCGIGHVGSSVIIGMIGIAIGVAVNKLVSFESIRGNVAAWLMIGFGFVYLIWGIRHSVKSRKHEHLHHHSDNIAHNHPHNHFEEHSHIHFRKSYKELTPWILFTIFAFGPCEPFIPILLYPVARHHLSDIILVTLTFTLTTIGTMITIVYLSLVGFSFFPKSGVERFLHPVAGAIILLCGLGIKFLGL
jgi:nickel/cobalt transporter (NicO) family protein